MADLKIDNAALDICEDAENFLQSAMWGSFKSRFGWNAKAFLIDFQLENVQKKCAVLVLFRSLIPGFSFAYIPWGPALPAEFPANEKFSAMSQLAVNLKKHFARNVVFIRFEFPWYNIQTVSYEESKKTLNNEALSLKAAGFKRAAATAQPPDTVHISLEASCEEILAAMKPKWRYNILLSEKKGVQVKSGGIHEIEDFFDLLKETAKRDGIGVHNIEYYKTLFDMCNSYDGKNIAIRLYIAEHEGMKIAANMVLFFGEIATYLYGASSSSKRNLMAPYALQWKAIKDAKEAGCKIYDLFGIPPYEDPEHPMAGLYRFKTGFGGDIIHRPGSWDYPYRILVYNAFNIAEAMRKKIRDLKKIKRG